MLTVLIVLIWIVILHLIWEALTATIEPDCEKHEWSPNIAGGDRHYRCSKCGKQAG